MGHNSGVGLRPLTNSCPVVRWLQIDQGWARQGQGQKALTTTVVVQGRFELDLLNDNEAECFRVALSSLAARVKLPPPLDLTPSLDLWDSVRTRRSTFDSSSESPYGFLPPSTPPSPSSRVPCLHRSALLSDFSTQGRLCTLADACS